ncbi:hypothetical protein BpHYR1_027289 [Brachionus plicatilis]|uniref:Uncharacterized protein n=1 Tax=Brachionus plicatilis TaxID=10195 RepID=A0A3M7P7S1_BRAPC|nr:hypothetical protein BpHYR1_027289 [Brachionus plicatilis]
MHLNKSILLICLLVTFFEWSHETDPFCQPLNPNIDPSNLPKLPQEFQTRIEINILNENRSEELFVKFDYYDKKGEIIKRARDKTSRTIYFFDKNEIFYLEDNRCSATKLNESSQNIYFGLMFDGNSYDMQQSNYFFHFNNGNPTVKLADTKWRDIPIVLFRQVIFKAARIGQRTEPCLSN